MTIAVARASTLALAVSVTCAACGGAETSTDGAERGGPGATAQPPIPACTKVSESPTSFALLADSTPLAGALTPLGTSVLVGAKASPSVTGAPRGNVFELAIGGAPKLALADDFLGGLIFGDATRIVAPSTTPMFLGSSAWTANILVLDRATGTTL